MTLTVAVAGGGIAGLTLAVALQSDGVEVTVLERQAEIRDAGAGISLWPNALAALDVVGLGDPVRALGRSIAAGGGRRVDGRVGATISKRSFEAALGEGMVCVDRGELVRALADRLRPGTVRTDWSVAGYQQGGSDVTVRSTSGEEVAFDALIGADGINSAVVEQMSGPLRSSYSGYTAWRGIAETAAGVASDEVWGCLAGGHEVGWMPVGANRTYWFATAWSQENQEFPDGGAGYLEQTFQSWPSPVPAVIAATPPDRLVRNDIIDRAMPDKWSHGRVTVVGDAAHPMRPHLGQGGCQAIEDAVVLARCLGAHDDPAEAFAAYERRRRRRARRIARLSRVSGFTRPPGLITSLSDRVTGALPGIPLGPVIRMMAPVAGYRAGLRATERVNEARTKTI